MNHSTGKPTLYEKERMEAMVRLGCAACATLSIPYAEVEVHHILDGGVRMGHWWTLPLCAGHHRGDFTQLQRELIPDCAKEKNILADALVSIASGRRVFARVYGTERDLWENVQKRLQLTMVWPPSKIVARRVSC